MRKNFTCKEARKFGYRIRRGSYYGTNNNCADRWYIDHVDDTAIDRRGRGFRTRQLALDWLACHLRSKGLIPPGVYYEDYAADRR